MKPDPNLEIRKICNLPADLTSDNWEVGFVDGQLLAHGASYDLIRAVAAGDHQKVRSEISMISDLEKRITLTKIIERIIPVIAQNV
jgi:hypothetical protein